MCINGIRAKVMVVVMFLQIFAKISRMSPTMKPCVGMQFTLVWPLYAKMLPNQAALIRHRGGADVQIEAVQIQAV